MTRSTCVATSSPTTRGRCAPWTWRPPQPSGSKPAPDGRARGVACSGFLSPNAQITEVSLDDRGRIHVERVVFALDCGIAVNPDLIRAQVEGGLLFGLSAAAWGEIVLGDGGDIVTQNFDRYPIMRMQSVPEIEIHLIDSDEPPTGVGEVSVPTTAPASPTRSPRSPEPASADSR